MDEKPKSIWKKSWTGWRGFLLWFILFFVVFLFGLAVASTNLPFAWLFAIGLALAGVILIASIRWLRCWRNFRQFLFGVACFATLIALFYAEENWRGKHDWEKFKRDWEAKGEHFDFASVVPPPVPDDQNFALTPIVFTSYGQILTREGNEIPYQQRDTNFVYRLKMNVVHNYEELPKDGNWQMAKISNLKSWRDYYRELAAKTNEFPVAPQPQSPVADVLLALSKYAPAIEELRQAAQLPYSRFPLDYDTEDPAEILLPHLSMLKQCSLALQLRAIAELQNDQSDQALADVKLALRLTDSIHTEPFLITHLVRIAMVQITLQPIYEGLAEHKWSEAQLAELDSELAKLDFLPDYRLAMRGEMVLCQEGVTDYLRRHPERLSNLSGDFGGGDGNSSSPGTFFNSFSYFSLIPSGWFYQNELRGSRFMVQQYVPLADLEHRIVSPASLRRAETAHDLEFNHANPYNRLEAMLLPSLGGAVKRFAYAQSFVDLARMAIALERHRLAHGEYPESLDVLAPQFMDKIPRDIITGQPLHYRRTGDGQFVLYSVGWNETDDGGVVVFEGKKTDRVDISQGDWVWRYPAK
jgi:hypothetical protein